MVFLVCGSVTAQEAGWKAEWPKTDFSRSSVHFSEIRSGGPGKDGIPAITSPRLINVSEANSLGRREPVMTVELPGERARAYPIRYLIWHEIVNDQIGTTPIAVTFCPLCNSGIVFDRRLNGRLLEFGVTGKLRNSDMVMYDRQTESWWQQFTGEAIIGRLMGRRLTRIPSWTESWAEFSKRNPSGLVMAQPAMRRNYGRNPYEGYDSSTSPFLYSGENPPHGIHPLARVINIGNRAWPLERLKDKTELTEANVTITWRAGTASALDKGNIARSRDIGSIRVRDAVTGRDIAHDVAFAFAFHAFYPEGIWMLGK